MSQFSTWGISSTHPSSEGCGRMERCSLTKGEVEHKKVEWALLGKLVCSDFFSPYTVTRSCVFSQTDQELSNPNVNGRNPLLACRSMQKRPEKQNRKPTFEGWGNLPLPSQKTPFGALLRKRPKECVIWGRRWVEFCGVRDYKLVLKSCIHPGQNDNRW